MINELKYIPKNIAEQFKELFKDVAKDCLKVIFEKEEEIYAFGVFTDSDISSFLLAYNTKGNLDTIIKSGVEYKNEFSITNLSDDFLKWWIPEWKNEIVEQKFNNDARTKKLHKILTDLVKPIGFSDDKTFSDYKEDIFAVFCQSLKELKEEGCFLNITEDFYLLVQEHDNGMHGTRKQHLSKILSENQMNELINFEKHYLSND